MTMIRTYNHFAIFFLLICCSTSIAQQSSIRFEYGSPNELKGVTKIYVYTGSDLEARNNIVKTIQKKLKDIIFTEQPEDAEIHLLFAADASTFYAGTWRNSTTTESGTVNAQGTYSGQSDTDTSDTAIYRKVVTGTGVVGRLKDRDTIRLLLDFEDSRSYLLERRPSTNFARAFIKAYEKANKDVKKE